MYERKYLYLPLSRGATGNSDSDRTGMTIEMPSMEAQSLSVSSGDINIDRVLR
jgi:hypothetical protein